MKKINLPVMLIAVLYFCLLSAGIAAAQQSTVALKNSYQNKEHGFSFSYPAGWLKVKVHDELVSILATKTGIKFPINMGVIYRTTDEPLPKSKGFLQEAYGDSLKVESLIDMKIDGCNAKKAVVTMTRNGQKAKQLQYFYKINGKMYFISCDMPYGQSEKYTRIFEAIMKSYKIKK